LNSDDDRFSDATSAFTFTTDPSYSPVGMLIHQAAVNFHARPNRGSNIVSNGLSSLEVPGSANMRPLLIWSPHFPTKLQ